MDVITITQLKIFAHHGVLPEETRDGQDFYVNAKLYLDTSTYIMVHAREQMCLLRLVN